MEQYKSPFAGKPDTEQHIDDQGAMSFTVTTRTLTPLRARVTDAVTTLLVLYIALIGIVIGIRQSDPWAWVFLVGGPLAGSRVIRRWIAEECETRTVMRFTDTSFAVKRGLFGKWESFDRRHAHRFALVPHDRAREEQAAHEYEQRVDQTKGRARWRTPYYQDSFVVSFEYLGQRNDLITVYGRTEALAILARLKACDEVMEAQARNGKGVPLTPRDEWGEQPGDIPETV